MSYESKLPRIAAELGARMDTAAKVAAERLEAQAKDRAPVATGALKGAIHTEREKVGEYQVIAGNTEVFYGHIVEHGSSHSAPRAFMTPATEQVRAELETIGKRALRGLG